MLYIYIYVCIFPNIWATHGLWASYHSRCTYEGLEKNRRMSGRPKIWKLIRSCVADILKPYGLCFDTFFGCNAVNKKIHEVVKNTHINWLLSFWPYGFLDHFTHFVPPSIDLTCGAEVGEWTLSCAQGVGTARARGFVADVSIVSIVPTTPTNKTRNPPQLEPFLSSSLHCTSLTAAQGSPDGSPDVTTSMILGPWNCCGKRLLTFHCNIFYGSQGLRWDES